MCWPYQIGLVNIVKSDFLFESLQHLTITPYLYFYYLKQKKLTILVLKKLFLGGYLKDKLCIVMYRVTYTRPPLAEAFLGWAMPPDRAIPPPLYYYLF